MKKDKITKDTIIADVLEKAGQPAVEIMLNHGLGCIGCHASPFETIEQGALTHGMNKKELDKMLKELNKVIK